MVSGRRAAGAGGGAAGEPAAWAGVALENKPARKPFSQARCSGVKGAESGRTGTESRPGLADAAPDEPAPALKTEGPEGMM